MSSLSSRSRARILHASSLALGLLFAACKSPSTPPQIPTPVAQASESKFRTPPPPDINIQLLLPDRSVPLDWLELDVFFPPGARRVGPQSEVSLRLSPDNRMKFPSAEIYGSPDGQFSLFNDGARYKKTQITHWLMLYQKEAAFPKAVFSTSTSFDASWAPDSKLFAVTHYVGSNSSEVFVGNIHLRKQAVDVTPFLRDHFPAHFVEGNLFVKAYRWTTDGGLVVRAIGRSAVAPFELFGMEILFRVVAAEMDLNRDYIRGFIKQ